jgi:hypothetical protein
LTGTATANLQVQIRDNGVVRDTVTVGSDGKWRYTLPGLTVATHSITAKAMYGSLPESAIRTFRVLSELKLTAPTVLEADPLTNTLNLLKPVNGVTVVIPHYVGLEDGDQVTMIWEGTAGAGSTSQTKFVSGQTPPTFGVSNATITPNRNRSVKVLYRVERTQRNQVLLDSPSLNMLIEYLEPRGTVNFTSGSTTFFQFTVPATITVPSDLGIGGVVATSPTVSATPSTLVYCSTRTDAFYLNMMGSQPATTSFVFPTGVNGVGLRIKRETGDRSGGLHSWGPGDATNGGTGTLEFVKTGPIVTSYIAAGILVEVMYGENRLYQMGWQLMNGITFKVD